MILNSIEGHQIPSSRRFQTNLAEDGNRYIVSAQKMYEYIQHRYGAEMISATQANMNTAVQNYQGHRMMQFHADTRGIGFNPIGHVEFNTIKNSNSFFGVDKFVILRN